MTHSTEPNKQDAQFVYRDTGDEKGRHYYYIPRQDDDMLAWSSPMFVNY